MENGRPSIVMVGIGPGAWDQLTLRAAERLSDGGQVFSRLAGDQHPVLARLEEEGRLVSLYALYEMPEITHRKKYEMFAEIVVRAAELHGRVIWAVPGNVFVFETNPWFIIQRCQQRGIDVEVVAGLSSIEAMYADAGVDPGDGVHILNADSFTPETRWSTELGTFVLQVFPDRLHVLDQLLRAHYAEEHEVVVLQDAGIDPDASHPRVRVDELAALLTPDAMEARSDRYELLSLYVPQVGAVPKWEQPSGLPAEGVIAKTPHIAECKLEDGSLLLVPLDRLGEGLEECQILLELRPYIRLWELLDKPASMGALREAMAGHVESDEELDYIVGRLAGGGLLAT